MARTFPARIKPPKFDSFNESYVAPIFSFKKLIRNLIAWLQTLLPIYGVSFTCKGKNDEHGSMERYWLGEGELPNRFVTHSYLKAKGIAEAMNTAHEGCCFYKVERMQ